MVEEELPEACKICMKLSGGDNANPSYIKKDGSFWACRGCVCDGGSQCLPKDRAMIVLLYKLLQALE